MAHRTERIAEQVRAEVARLLREETSDPRVRLVTLTRVDVSPDLSNAIVFWSVMNTDDAEDIERIEDGLESAAGFLRRRLARELPLRKVPALRFRHDPSIALGNDTLKLIRDIGRGETS